MKAATVVLAFGAVVALTTHCVARADPTEVPPRVDATITEVRPTAAVVVTQCSQLVAVYLVMPNGRLLRFDRMSGVPWDRLLAAAYSATRSERVEVSCNGAGIVGYETHEPV